MAWSFNRKPEEPATSRSPLADNEYSANPLLSEFSADNERTLTDEDGEFSDWIEVYNAGDAVIDLAGWHLTDDTNDLDKWSFPSERLNPD